MELERRTTHDFNVILIDSSRVHFENSLFKWNAYMGCLHFFQAIAALYVGLSLKRLKNFKIPMVTSFPSWETGYPIPDQQIVGYLPFVPVASAFAWLSAVFHFIIMLNFEKYVKDLQRGINQFRWIEYALSSSLMIGLIATLFGVYDVFALTGIMASNALMNLFGFSMELHNMNRIDKPVNWTNFAFGSIAGLVPWTLIIAQAAGTPGIEHAPGFIWAVLAVYFVLFCTFPINMYLQYSVYKDILFRGSRYHTGEKVYQFLSLFSKSVLLWLVVGGANSPNAFNAFNSH